MVQSQQALLCPHSPTENPWSLCPGGQRRGLWALSGHWCHSASVLPWAALAKCSGTGWKQGTPKQVRSAGRSRGVPPSALVAPRSIYLYQVEQLHQEKRQFSPGWGVFGSTEPVGRGSSDTRGALSPCGSLVSLLYIVWGCLEPGQSCPHGTRLAFLCSLSRLLAPLGAES